MFSLFAVVDTNTGRLFEVFTEERYAMQSIKISYCRRMKGEPKELHRDAWRVDLECDGEFLTIRRVQPKDFAEHL